MPEAIKRIIKKTSRQPKTGRLCLYVRKRTYNRTFVELRSWKSDSFALCLRWAWRVEEIGQASYGVKSLNTSKSSSTQSTRDRVSDCISCLPIWGNSYTVESSYALL